MALYLAKNGASPTPIYPVPTSPDDPITTVVPGFPPVIGQLAAGELVTVLYQNTDANQALIKSVARAGWIPNKVLTKQPFLAVDLYRQELGGKPPMDKIVGTPWLSAVLIKCTQGTSYPTQWFRTQWPLIRTLAAERYGVSFFRGAYQYLVFGKSGKAQAEYYLKTVESAGGWGAGDIVPIVDVENGKDPAQTKATAQQVIDVTTEYAETILRLHGRVPMLYGGSAIRDRHITVPMGCQKLWCARYTAQLPSKTYTTMGWALPDVWGWQYGGTGPAQRAQLVGYPKDIPGVGQLDISVMFADTFADLVVTPLS